MSKVKVPIPLRVLTGEAEVESHGRTVKEIIEDLDKKFPGIKKRICDEKGQLRKFLNFYLNDEDIRFLKNQDTPVKEGDQITIVPAIAGGPGHLGLWDLKSYRNTDFHTKTILHDETYYRKREDLQRIFSNKRVRAVILCGNTQEVIVDKEFLETKEFEDMVSEIEKKENKPAMIVTRPVVLEELGCDHWYDTGDPSTYYPAMEIYVTESSRTNACIIKGTFDTGSPEIYCSFDVLNESGAIEDGFRRRFDSEVWGRHFQYFNCELYVLKVGIKTIQNFKMVFKGVINWTRSPFWENYPNRDSLIGRRLMNQGGLCILLDGSKKTTSIL